jgi:putative ABC transport system permease protein
MIFAELRQAARSLSNRPGFTLTAIATIALGIGATTATFSVVNAVLLRPLPYLHADRLVIVWGDMRARNVRDFPFPPGDFYDLRHNNKSFDDVGAVVTGRQAIGGAGSEPEQIRTAGVTPNFFRLLGARVMLGRDFTDADAQPAPQPPNAQQDAFQPPPPQVPAISILSHSLWLRRFGGDRSVLGRTIDLGNGRAEIVGVLAPGFEVLFPPGTNVERLPDLYSAMRLDYRNASRNNVFLRVVARLKEGVSLEQAQVDADGIAADLRQRFPIKKTAGLHLRLEPMHKDVVKDVRPSILALMGSVLFLLLIACSNVANLLLVRASSRIRELAVRSALGGSRWRLIRQMLAESLLLAAAGAVAGVLIASSGVQALITLGPEGLPRMDGVSIDKTVLAFAALITLLSTALFGIVPAVRASSPDLMEALRAGGRAAALGSGRRLRNAVVVTEVALSFALLIGSGLMLRSLVALQRVDPGFDAQGLLTFSIAGVQLQRPEQRAAFVRQVRQKLSALPGVESVTAATPLPLDGAVFNGRWGTEEAAADPSKFQQATANIVLPGYFETMRTALREGRTFTEADNVPEPRRMIIDELMAKKAFPGQSAVGKRILTRLRTEQPELFEVIGVVAHQRAASLATEGREAFFVPDGYFGHAAIGRWAVRASGELASLVSPIRSEIRAIDPKCVVAEVLPMTAYVTRAQATTRFTLVLIGVFAAAAALLAAVGLYGVLAAAVQQRTAEIGVRMAMGAEPSGIFRMMVGDGLRLSVAGLVLGCVAAIAFGYTLRNILVGVEPVDPPTYAVMAAVFLLFSAIASWLPARRAAGLDPTTALREE